jgi:TPR repeat protein
MLCPFPLPPLLAAILAAALLCAALPAGAQDESLPVPALRAGAEAGDPDAQYALARAFERGAGVARDDFEAVRWLRAAAAQDHPEASRDLGWMLANGYGVAKDGERAYYWFARAAALGAEGADRQRDATGRTLDAERRAALSQEALRGIDAPAVPASPPALAALPAPSLAPGEDFASLRATLNAGGGPDVLAKLRLLAQNGSGDDAVRARNLLGLALMRSTDPADRDAGMEHLFAAARAGLPAAQYNMAAALMERARAGAALNDGAVRRWLDLAEAGSAPADPSDYAAIAREFAARGGERDLYRAARQGSPGAYPELRELILLARQELRALSELHGARGSPAPSDAIESVIIE